MNEIELKRLSLHDCFHINDIDPSQYIKYAWREVDGKRQLIHIDYHENDWPNGFQYHLSKLKKTVNNNGAALGAFSPDGRMCGFVTINRQLFGRRYKYVLLDQLYVSLKHRGKGIGRKLFIECTDIAREWKAEKIYICAGSAEETIKFYFAIGCREAVEINRALYESDPRDFQLEYDLASRPLAEGL